jgi:molybdopterin-dependent oxidoreductase alpha subunit
MEKTNIQPEPKAQPPARFTGIKLTKPSDTAAGIPAILVSAQHILRETIPGKAFATLLKLNQKDGFDCPGCAWPDPDDHRSAIGEYCENGVKAIAEELDKKKADPAFFFQNSVYDLSLKSDYELGKSGRLTHPMVIEPGETHYKKITWDDAFALMAKKLNQLSSPDEGVFYTSGRTSNEAAFLYQLFVREFGTNNLPDCSNMCHESSGVALNEAIGIGKGSVKLDDFYKTDLVIILGQNPGTNHPRMMSALQIAKKKGAKIISVNPLKEAGLLAFKDPKSPMDLLGRTHPLSDLYLQPKINGDMAFLKALMILLAEADQQQEGKVFDWKFIREQSTGAEAYLASLKKYSFGQLCRDAGLTEEEVRAAAAMVQSSTKIIACWAMGLTQHKNAVATIQEVMNLLFLKGSIGKEGAGACPVRGHSNVQGDRTMGIYEKPSAAFLDKLDAAMEIQSPRKHGYDTVECIHAMQQGKAKVFIAMGGNFLSATPDTEYTAKALRNCELTVHVSTKLNRSHLITGKYGLILPCLGRSDKDVKNGKEQFVTVEDSMGVVHASQGSLVPPSPYLLSETEIVCRLALSTLGQRTKTPWNEFLHNYDLIREKIEAAISGFDDFNQRVRKPGGFYLPNGAREGKFKNAGGKALFTVSDWKPIALKEEELIMMTIRSHDQFNTTIYGLDDRYRGILNERRVILMNQKDIQRLGYQKSDLVDLLNHHEQVERIAEKFIVLPFDIPEQCCATYFPEANVLVPINSFADRSQTPTSKSVIITLRKHKA